MYKTIIILIFASIINADRLAALYYNTPMEINNIIDNFVVSSENKLINVIQFYNGEITGVCKDQFRCGFYNPECFIEKYNNYTIYINDSEVPKNEYIKIEYRYWSNDYYCDRIHSDALFYIIGYVIYFFILIMICIVVAWMIYLEICCRV